LLAAARWGLGLALAVIAALLAVASFVPGGTMIAGIVVTVPGILLILYGFFTGAYIAYTEDFLYAFLYVVFPIYTAYYIVSRWDDMQSRVAFIVAGVVLATVGVWILEAGLAQEKGTREVSAGAKPAGLVASCSIAAPA
jgi:hypothetical protein